MYKVKRLVFVSLAITAFMMTGCSSDTTSPRTPDTAIATVPTEAMFMPSESAPKPDEAQSAKLLADLNNVSPALNTPVSIERARAVCEDIIAGKSGPELSQRVSAVFSSTANGSLSELQISDVLKVINESGFCKKS